MERDYNDLQLTAAKDLTDKARGARAYRMYANQAPRNSYKHVGLRGDKALEAADRLRDSMVGYLAAECQKREPTAGFALSPKLADRCKEIARIVDEQVPAGPENYERRLVAMERVFANGNEDRHSIDDPETILERLNEAPIMSPKPHDAADENASYENGSPVRASMGEISRLVLEREVGTGPAGRRQLIEKAIKEEGRRLLLPPNKSERHEFDFKHGYDEEGDRIVPIENHARDLMEDVKERIRTSGRLFADPARDDMSAFNERAKLRSEVRRLHTARELDLPEVGPFVERARREMRRKVPLPGEVVTVDPKTKRMRDDERVVSSSADAADVSDSAAKRRRMETASTQTRHTERPEPASSSRPRLEERNRNADGRSF